MTDTERAALYASIGWKQLEFEERAHARDLIRRGFLRWVSDTNGKRVSPNKLELVTSPLLFSKASPEPSDWMSMRTIECGKCDGKGSITGFGHIENGRCFVCQGSGTVSAKNRTAREIAFQNVMGSLSTFQDEMCQPVRVEDTDYYRAYAKRAARAFKMYAMWDSADARKILRTLHSTAQHLIVEAAK